MNVAILTWEEEGKQLYNLLSSDRNHEYHVKCIAEVRSHLWGSVKNDRGEEIKIGSLAHAASLYRQNQIDYFIVPSLNESPNGETIVRRIKKYEIPESALLYAPISIFKDSTLSDEERIASICLYRKRKELDYLEFHVADHCNLNCKNCSMFSGLVEGEVFADYEKTRAGLLKVKTFFDHIKVFRILGGEPLLNDKLEDYISLVRSLYPYTDIRVITNGILVRSMKPSLIKSLRENQVSFIVTGYPALENIHDDVAEFLRKNEIKHVVGPTLYRFNKIYNKEGDSDPETAFCRCIWRGTCANIKENKIATCFVPFVLPYLIDHFNLGQVRDDTIDLFEKGLTTEALLDRLNNEPMDACRYCSQKRLSAAWELMDKNSKNCIEDWAV